MRWLSGVWRKGRNGNCPACGKDNRDLWDHDWGTRESFVTSCDHCGEDYVLARHVSVSYEAMRVIDPPRTKLPMQSCVRKEVDDE